MGYTEKTLHLASTEATSDAARALAALCQPGDTLLMEGPVGAGKTHFARAFIQSLLEVPEDVPSPTFTIVQEYDTTKGSIWHCDLYRVGSSDIDELGLVEAFDTAICLIEWPDRLGELSPSNALTLTLDPHPTEDGRTCTFSWTDARWNALNEVLEA